MLKIKPLLLIPLFILTKSVTAESNSDMNTAANQVDRINQYVEKASKAAIEKNDSFMRSQHEKPVQESKSSEPHKNTNKPSKSTYTKKSFDKRVTKKGVRSYLSNSMKYEQDMNREEQLSKRRWIEKHDNATGVWEKERVR